MKSQLGAVATMKAPQQSLTWGLYGSFCVSMQRAEFCAFCNCVMDRTTLDSTLSDSPGAHSISARPDVAGGAHIPLTNSQFKDLITVHLADWLEQVRPQQLQCRECAMG